MKNKFLWIALPLMFFIGACHPTYYQKNEKFNKLFEEQKLEEADAILAKEKHPERKKTKFLYYLNRGIIANQLCKYEESNSFFEQAYNIQENFSTNVLEEALSFVINANMVEYKGEDHEVLFINYYKALNYLQLDKNDDALVECRRLNIKLNLLSDRYSDTNKYSRDAFIETLIGIIYQANYDYNNAFISYRNALDIYEDDYARLFGLQVPEQLKKDLIYSAHKTGFYDQVDYYKQLFNLDYDPKKESDLCDVVFLWHNGLGPIKDEWAIDFVLVAGVGGVVNFKNDELGLCFPFPLPSGTGNGDISDLNLIRVAFPKYKERELVYDCGEIVETNNGKVHKFEILEDVNAISFQVLKQRMMWEFSKSLIRVAIKKFTEYQLSSQNKVLGALVGGLNYMTEQADTRNWQTLPHSISYVRLRLPEGNHRFTFKTFSSKLAYKNNTQNIECKLQKGITTFKMISTPSYVQE